MLRGPNKESNMTITTNLVSVGGGRFISIPDQVIDKLGLSGQIDLIVESDGLVIRPHPVRQGWDEQFRQMAAAGNDTLLETAPSDWDEAEWQW